MRTFLVLCVGLLGVVVVASDSPTFGQSQTSKSDSCSRCHELGSVLPSGHPKVAVATISDCAGCHTTKPGNSGSNPFLTRLHSAHVTADVACTTCHQWRSGRRFVVPGFGGKTSVVSTEADLDLVTQAAHNWATVPNLANIHGKMNFFCASCHREDLIPDANATAINAQCIACHGGLEKVASSFKGPSYLNPHASHLGNIPCTSCHFAHQTSKAYCLNCHQNFNMPIPGGVASGKPTNP